MLYKATKHTVPNNDLPYEYEVFRLLTSIKKTFPGPDKLPYWFFRYAAAAELTPVITHLIRLTLSNGTPPDAWKHVVITPVPKVASPQNLSDLRPISVTPILSRLVEKLIVINISHITYQQNFWKINMPTDQPVPQQLPWLTLPITSL